MTLGSHFRTANKALRFENVVKWLSNIKPIIYISFAAFAVIFGYLLNSLNPMDRFVFKAPFGFVLLVILLYSLNKFRQIASSLEGEMSGDAALFALRKRFSSRCNANVNYLACVIMPIFFCVISVQLDFVKMSPIGIFSLIGLFGIVFLAFVGFQQYIYILLLLWEISIEEIQSFDRFLPHSTKWFNALVRLSENYKSFFLILGTLFILLFTLFTPHNTVKILIYEGRSSELFWPLVLSWTVIVFAIIILFPASALAHRFLLKKILQNMKSSCIDEYTKLAKGSSGVVQLLYIDIISKMDRETKLPDNLVSKLVPIFTTSLNLLSVAIAMLADLHELGYSL